MIIFGAGGHGKVVLALLVDQRIPVDFILDDNEQIESFCGHEVKNAKDFKTLNEYQFIMAIGDNLTRYQKVNELGPILYGTIAHSTSVIAMDAQLGDGSVVMPLSVINPSANIGSHCIVNSGAVVEHDCQIGDFAHVAPNATVCGDCSIGKGSLVGAGAVIRPGIQIGEWCTIGAGAVVIRDLEDGKTAVGNPANSSNS